MMRFFPVAEPAVRSSWSLKSSGVAFLTEESCFSAAVVRMTAHVSGSASDAATLPCTISCTARLVAHVGGFAHPAKPRDGRSGLLGFLGIPLLRYAHAMRGEGGAEQETRGPLLPGLL